MNIFLDFDGTIVDPSVRYWMVYVYCLGECLLEEEPFKLLDQQEYWSLKRQHMSENAILARHYPEIDTSQYHAHRQPIIESSGMLSQDPLLPGTSDALGELGELGSLYMVTLRKNREGLMAQLQDLHIASDFEEILSRPGGTEPHQVKIDLIGDRSGPGDWLIGDTEADLIAGRMLGLTTCGVTSGIRTRAYLESLEPNHVVDSLLEVPALIRRG